MSIPTPRRLRVALPTAAIALLAALPAAALSASPRHVPGTGNGQQPTTGSPDLRSVSIDPGNDLTDGLGERARFCFDANIASAGGAFALMSYDARRYWSGTGTRATDDEKCAVVTFPAGSDLAQATVGQVGAGAVADVAGHKNIVASEPVAGSVARPVAGATTGPDLVSVTTDVTDAAHKRVKYVFDENLNPSPSRPDGPDADDPPQPENRYQAQDFGYVLQDGDAQFHAAGNAPNPSGNSITIDFGTAPIDQAVRFVTQPNAVEDRPQTGKLGNLSLVTPSSPGVVIANAATGGRPDLRAAESAGANAYRLTFTTGVSSPNAARFLAVGDDGTVSAVAASAGTGGTQDSVLVQFPDSEVLTKDPGSVVRIIATDGAVTNSIDNSKGSIYAQVATQTPNDRAGYTNGPDLLGVSIDGATQRATFHYDEPVAAGAPAAGFLGLRTDATSVPGQGGVATTGAAVTVPFGADIGSLIAYGQPYAAVSDAAGRPNPNQSVSKDPQLAAPIPLPTPVPSTTRKKVRTGFKSFRRKSRTHSGRLSSAEKTCRYKRRVILRKRGQGTRRYGQALTRSDGTFTIRRSRRIGGRIYAVVTAKTTSRIQCRTRTSKTIRG